MGDKKSFQNNYSFRVNLRGVMQQLPKCKLGCRSFELVGYVFPVICWPLTPLHHGVTLFSHHSAYLIIACNRFNQDKKSKILLIYIYISYAQQHPQGLQDAYKLL